MPLILNKLLEEATKTLLFSIRFLEVVLVINFVNQMVVSLECTLNYSLEQLKTIFELLRLVVKNK